MADDDPEDVMLARDALAESRLANALNVVADGEELLDYLYQRGKYNESNAPRPGLILLDLNMPRLDGREALARIKNDASLRRIPVVVLTTSKAEEDVFRSYDLGANSYITKPVTFDSLVNVVRSLAEYWFGIVMLPGDETS
ncbi:response regulator [bacterium]|nr:MAG: response regulator [bacterium]